MTLGFLLSALVAFCFLVAACGGGSSGVATPSPTPLPSVPTYFEGVRVTYIGNSGVLITVRDTQVLIDSLFEGFPGGYVVPPAIQELMLNARAPFDGVDVVLATHNHADHFGATSVSRHLQSNPRAVFAGPSDAAAAVTGFGERVMALEVEEGARETIAVNGVRVDAMRISHGVPQAGTPSIVNLGYLITIGNVKFFHTGDWDPAAAGVSYLQQLGLPTEGIDVAFISHFILSAAGSPQLVADGIRPGHVVAIHFQYSTVAPQFTLIQSNFPQAVLFRSEFESWVMPQG